MIDEISIIPFRCKIPVLLAHLKELLHAAVREQDYDVVEKIAISLKAIKDVQELAEESYIVSTKKPLNEIQDIEDGKE